MTIGRIHRIMEWAGMPHSYPYQGEIDFVWNKEFELESGFSKIHFEKEQSMRELRIHHFFDIIRDYGDHKVLTPHDYGHSYHQVGQEIYDNGLSAFRVIIGNDDICEGCRCLEAGRCLDTIGHRPDYKSKEAFNDYLDKRIMAVLGYRPGQVLKVRTVIEDAAAYLDSIFEIYKGNDPGHTEMRKRNVSAGIAMKKRELGLLPDEMS